MSEQKEKILELIPPAPLELFRSEIVPMAKTNPRYRGACNKANCVDSRREGCHRSYQRSHVVGLSPLSI